MKGIPWWSDGLDSALSPPRALEFEPQFRDYGSIAKKKNPGIFIIM